MLKNSDIKELNDAVASALNGKRFISRSLASRPQLEPIPTNRYESLTVREREILQLIGEGLTMSEISETLSISVRTVEKHRSNLMQKLEVKNYAGLIRFALQRGLIPFDIDGNRTAD